MKEKVKIFCEKYGYILGILPNKISDFGEGYLYSNYIFTNEINDAIKIETTEAQRIRRNMVLEGISTELVREE